MRMTAVCETHDPSLVGPLTVPWMDYVWGGVIITVYLFVHLVLVATDD